MRDGPFANVAACEPSTAPREVARRASSSAAALPPLVLLQARALIRPHLEGRLPRSAPAAAVPFGAGERAPSRCGCIASLSLPLSASPEPLEALPLPFGIASCATCDCLLAHTAGSELSFNLPLPSYSSLGGAIHSAISSHSGKVTTSSIFLKLPLPPPPEKRARLAEVLESPLIWKRLRWKTRTGGSSEMRYRLSARRGMN